MKIKKLILLLFTFFLFWGIKINAQMIVSGSEKLDNQIKTESVNTIAKILDENYIFPEVGKKMGEYIQSKLSNGDYNDIDDPMQFCIAITKDLQSVSKDKHVNLNFNPKTAKELLKGDREKNPELEKMMFEEMKRANFGFQKVEILTGNIGYINLVGFAGFKYAKPTLVSAMKLIENSEAVIFDLRENGGGDGETVNLLCSYFLAPGININNAHFRNPDTTMESWTLKDIEGKRMLDVPLYILTSSRTFSAAEEFAYDLKNQKRAVIIGETTGGGANPNNFFAVNDKFVLSSAIGQSINPVSKTNWEVVGVTPDIASSRSEALDLAKMDALEKIAAVKDDPKMKARYSWLAENIKFGMKPVIVDENTLKNYAGIYEDRTVSFEDGKLYYQRTGRPKMQMIPINEDLFMFKDIDYFRIKFVRDANGNVTELTGMYDDGNTDKSIRNN